MDMLSYLLGKNAGGAKGLKVEVVETLPQIGESNVLYLVSKQTAETSNVFDEYLYINNAWEKIGTTDIDLSGYVTDEELLQALATKQNTLTAGDNITIENNVISASGGESIVINSSDTNAEKLVKLQKVYDNYLEGKSNECWFKTTNSMYQLSSIYDNTTFKRVTFVLNYFEAVQNNYVPFPISETRIECNRNDENILLNINSSDAYGGKLLSLLESSFYADYNKFALGLRNTVAYTPNAGSYNPATAKYAEEQAEAVKVQYSTMPTASADNLGKIVQYTGATDSTYTNGHFYIVVSDGETEPTYSWEEISLGGSTPSNEFYYDIKTSLTFNQNYQQKTGSNDLTILSNIVNTIYQNNLNGIYEPILHLTYDNASPAYERLIHVYCSDDVNYRSTRNHGIVFIGLLTNDNGNTPSKIQMPQIRFARFTINGNWSNNVFTATGWIINTGLLNLLSSENEMSYSVTNDYTPAHKKYVDDKLTTLSGYDATKTQVLKNVNGTLQWITEE